MKFLSIDFETANDSLMSACAIGSVYFEETKPESTNHSLIKPPIFHRKLKEENFNIHNIDYKTYSKGKNFKKVWSELTTQIPEINHEDTVFVCFNAIFDVSVLMNLLKKYKISKNFIFVDPMQVAKQIWVDRESYSLKNLCNDLEIELDHHNPLSDAKAAGILLIKQLQITKKESLKSLLNEYGLNFIKTDYKKNGFYDHYGDFKNTALNFQDIKKK